MIFTPEKLKKLKKAYLTAVKKGKTTNDVFTFEDNKLLIGYAKYLIQFLEQNFNIKGGEQ